MNETVLLADDEAGIRNVLEISLADAGYDVITTDNGEKALEVFRKVRPAIVLADIKMPGMGGMELLRRIKTEEAETEVIMITGHGDLALAIQSLKLEATDFITKPISEDALEIALKRANERISMRNALKKYTENLEHLVEEKTIKLISAERLAAAGETVAGLSHAIKNIASGLEGGAFVLEKGIELDERKYLLQGWEMLKGNVDKIKNLSLDLLNFAKPVQIEYRLYDPNAPAREVAELMKTRAEEHNVTLKTELSPDLEDFLFDPEAVHRCLLNLVTNAIDACRDNMAPDKKKEVLLKSKKIDGWAVEYQVQDNCCGMTPEVKEKALTAFFSTKGMQGTGIGLMLTKKMIDEHNGFIEVESQYGSGTTFTVRLPKTNQF
jgi:signal transduction histidine kinase